MNNMMHKCLSPAETNTRLSNISELFKYAGSTLTSQEGGNKNECQKLDMPLSLFSKESTTRSLSDLSPEQQSILNEAFESTLFLYGSEDLRYMEPLFKNMVLKAMDYFEGEDKNRIIGREEKNESVTQNGGVGRAGRSKSKSRRSKSNTDASDASETASATPESTSNLETKASSGDSALNATVKNEHDYSSGDSALNETVKNEDNYSNMIFELTAPGYTFYCVDNIFVISSATTRGTFFFLGKAAALFAQTGVSVGCKMGEVAGVSDAVSNINSMAYRESKKLIDKTADMIGYHSKMERSINFIKYISEGTSSVSEKYVEPVSKLFYASVKFVWMIFALVMFVMTIINFAFGLNESYSTSNISLESVRRIMGNSYFENIFSFLTESFDYIPDSYQDCITNASHRNVVSTVLSMVFQPKSIYNCMNLQLIADQAKVNNQYDFVNYLWVTGVEPWIAYSADKIRKRNKNNIQSAGKAKSRRRKVKKQKKKTRKQHKRKTRKSGKKKAKKRTTKKR